MTARSEQSRDLEADARKLIHPAQAADAVALWRRLTVRLNRWRGDWDTLVDGQQSQPSSNPFQDECALSDEEIFEAFATALISGNTRWDRIAAIRAQLHEPFQGFSPLRYAELSDKAIDEVLLPWFRRRGAGSAGLRGGLRRLRQAAAKLGRSDTPNGGQRYLEAALASANGSPEMVAMLLGGSPNWKLPGFGIALAAEALRLLGFDLCKPDRHILRAVGSWRHVRFARWNKVGEYTAPQARPVELLAAMLAVRELAEANGLRVSYANSVIWTAGAISGAHLTNLDFEDLAKGLLPKSGAHK